MTPRASTNQPARRSTPPTSATPGRPPRGRTSQPLRLDHRLRREAHRFSAAAQYRALLRRQVCPLARSSAWPPRPQRSIRRAAYSPAQPQSVVHLHRLTCQHFPLMQPARAFPQQVQLLDHVSTCLHPNCFLHGASAAGMNCSFPSRPRATEPLSQIAPHLDPGLGPRLHALPAQQRP